MKKKLIALILSLVLCLSAGILPAMNASAATPIDQLDQLKAVLEEKLTAAAEQSVAAPAATNRVAAVKIGSPTATINAKKTQIDPDNKKVVPIIKNGRTMVPLRFSASAMGGKTKYISDKDFITVTVGEKIAKFKINSKTLQIVDKKGKVLKTITMDVAATKINGRVLVPLRAISEGLGCKVYYEKFAAGEIVVVSLTKLSAQEKTYYMAQLLNMSNYTFTNKAKTASISLPGAWNKVEEEKEHTAFASMLYPIDGVFMLQGVSVSEAKEFVVLTQAELKAAFEEPGVTIVDFSKSAINGKKAIRFTMKMVEDGEVAYIDFCVLHSGKVGIIVTSLFFGDTKARSEYKTALGTIKLLK